MPLRPAALGFSPERLKRIDRFFDERYISPGRLPCALTLIHRRGETVHLSVQGKADIERDVALDEGAIFRIYSMTKPVTSVALMMLVEAGSLQLDDPVHRFMPDWRDLGVYAGGTGEPGAAFRHRAAKRPMTVLDLLRHTSGLTYGIQQRSMVDAAYRARIIGVPGIRNGLSLEQMIAEVKKLPLEYSPGDQWLYSIATDVVGHLVAKISGLQFETFVRDRILAPLDMTDADFFVPQEKAARLTACYTIGRNAKPALLDDPQSSSLLEPPAFYSGGGGLVSTAGDYLKFCRMMLGGGRLGQTRILGRKTVEMMTANHLPDKKLISDIGVGLFADAYPGVGFGLCGAVTVDPIASLTGGSAGDYFWGGWASTYFFVDPKEELICIFMTQLGPSTFYQNIRRELRALVYSSLID